MVPPAPAPARAVRANFDFSRADEVAALIIPSSPVPQQYHNTDDVGELRLGSGEGTSEGSDDEASDDDDAKGEGVEESGEENVKGSGAKNEETQDSKRPNKRARGDRLGKDVNVEVIQAVQPKFYSKPAGARGVTVKTANTQATFKHDAAKDKQIIYFEGDLRPLVLAAQRRHHTGRSHPPVTFSGSGSRQGRAALDRLLQARLLEMDVDAFDTPAYAQFLNDCIHKYRKSFLHDADAVTLLAATSAAAAEVKRHPVRIDFRIKEKDIAFEMPQGRKRTLGKQMYVEPDVKYLHVVNRLEGIDIHTVADVEALLPVRLVQLDAAMLHRRPLTPAEKVSDALVALFYYAARAELALKLQRQAHETIDEVQKRFLENVKAVAEKGAQCNFTISPSGKPLITYAANRRAYGSANVDIARGEFELLEKLVKAAEATRHLRVVETAKIWAEWERLLALPPAKMAESWKDGAWNAHRFTSVIAKRILARGSITPGAIEPSYRSQACRIIGSDRPLKSAHGRGELLLDDKMLTAFLCVDHATHLRVWQPGRNYHISDVAYSMEKAWPEQYLHGGNLPPFLAQPVARADILSCVVRGTGVELHAPFRTIASGNQLVEMLRGALAYIPAIGLDIPEDLFTYVQSARAPVFKSFLLTKEYIRYTEASSVYTSGMPSLDRQLSFIAIDDEHIGMHVLPNLQLTDRWIQSATIGSWMSSSMMDIVNQALVVANAPGLSEEERFVIVAGLDARVEEINNSEAYQRTGKICSRVNSATSKSFDQVIKPHLAELRSLQGEMLRGSDWALTPFPCEQDGNGAQAEIGDTSVGSEEVALGTAAADERVATSRGRAAALAESVEDDVEGGGGVTADMTEDNAHDAAIVKRMCDLLVVDLATQALDLVRDIFHAAHPTSIATRLYQVSKQLDPAPLSVAVDALQQKVCARGNGLQLSDLVELFSFKNLCPRDDTPRLWWRQAQSWSSGLLPRMVAAINRMETVCDVGEEFDEEAEKGLRSRAPLAAFATSTPQPQRGAEPNFAHLAPFMTKETNNPVTLFLTLARQWHVLGPRDHATLLSMKPARTSANDDRSANVMTVCAHQVHDIRMWFGWIVASPTSWSQHHPQACNVIGELLITNLIRKSFRPTALLAGVYRRITPDIVSRALVHLKLDDAERDARVKAIVSRNSRRKLQWRADPVLTGMTVNVLSDTEQFCFSRRVHGYDQWWPASE